MNSDSKTPKVATSASDIPEDRLSSLPDSILCHILSFLPTKNAANTSVLSKRWKHLFLSVPNIDLNEEGNRRTVNCDFIHFVNRRFLLSTKSSITEFRLKCRRLPAEPHVTELWLNTLLFCNVKVLEIQIQEGDVLGSSPLFPTSRIFQSETLVVLKLYGSGIVLNIPEIVSCPNLKVLNLQNLKLQYASDYLMLAEGFPLLEDMRLECIKFQNKRKNEAIILKISMCTLKKLAICRVEHELNRIDIDTPNLQHLECGFSLFNTNTPKMRVNVHNCESLVWAYLWNAGCPLFGVQPQWCIELLSKVKNVKELRLSGEGPQGFSNAADMFPPFRNLIHLELIANADMWILLQHAPNLKVLVCGMSYLGVPGTPENEPVCLVQNLKEIRISNFKGDEAEFETVKYFLQHGLVLERMMIDRGLPETAEWPASTWKQLLKLRRQSPICEIELID